MQVLPREILSNNWVTLVLLFAFVLLFFMKVFQPSLLYGYATAFFSNGFIKKRIEERPQLFSAFHLFLFLFSTAILSLFFILVINALHISIYIGNFHLFFPLVIGYFLIRFFIDYAIGKIANISEPVRYFLFSKSGYLYSLSLLLFPVIILYNYTFTNIYFLLFSFIILLFFRFLLVFFNNKKLILNYLFYFILYLCTLEIAPLLIVYKLLIK